MAIPGKGGKLKVGATPTVVAELEDWNLDINADLIDVTNLDSNGWKQFLQGLKEWAGKATANYMVHSDTNGQKALQDALLNGTTVQLEFNLNGTNKYTGTAYVKKVGVASQLKDKIKVDFEFTGSGALTFA